MRGVIRLLPAGLAVAAVTAAAIFAVVAATPVAVSAQGGPERITSYDTAFAIQRNGSVVVTEQIVYDFGGNKRHGIIRVIPVKFRYNGSYDRTYTLTVLSVQSPDAPAQYQAENNGSSVSIRIGDPGQLVTGQHTYRLTYRLRGVLTAYASHDEFYWNATGNQWNVPIGRAAVQVSAPAQVTRAVCYAGPAGSTRPCQQGGITNGSATFTQSGLGPHEGVTVAVAIPAGVVPVPRPVLEERWTLQRAFAATPATLGVSGGLLLALMAAGALIMRARRRDRLPARPQDATLAETAPPEGLRPGQAGLLLTGVAGSREITATIVDLAVRGYLRIEEEQRPGSRDWKLVLPPQANGQFGGLLDYEQTLLGALLKNAVQEEGIPHVWLSLVAAAVPLRQVRNELYRQAPGRGWFTARPDRVRRRWRIAGCVVLVISLLMVLVVAASTDAGLVAIPFVLAGLAMIAGARWMPVRTEQGRQLASRLLAFQDYIKTATVAQARTGGPGDALYDYLPYAIVFGCTSEWAEATAALTGTSQAPSWYRGTRPLSVTDMALLARAAYYFTPRYVATHGHLAGRGPSGGSGFSGGYSGGGMGGGGGGSW
ncbi:MAG: DUF2207 domain-containing protein [Micromonosporaceae bacterium]